MALRALGHKEMADLAAAAALGTEPIDNLINSLQKIADNRYLSEGDVRPALVRGWEAAVDLLMQRGVPTPEQEDAVQSFGSRYDLSFRDLDEHGAYSRLLQVRTLRDIMNGTLPQLHELLSGLPFNFQKTERLVWNFPGTHYYEDKNRTRYVGSSQGVSVRIAKGLSYRIGVYEGEPISYTERVWVDTGHFAVTNKHLYFAGNAKSVRVRYDKIVSFVRYSDGVGICRDAMSAKPQVFVTGDGWFTFNLVSAVAQM